MKPNVYFTLILFCLLSSSSWAYNPSGGGGGGSGWKKDGVTRGVFGKRWSSWRWIWVRVGVGSGGGAGGGSGAGSGRPGGYENRLPSVSKDRNKHG
ncbi:hypothetical protein Acr_02g0002500 [Actinidia rufa]|uniref:Glycine-rich protein n=1 Tax=Actinidia rufa TaxID=165716 RepID=A0A7J0E6G5_9ERIC|nr:hypothetical protein Acr_02g0002500 [Actinidia rufa]